MRFILVPHDDEAAWGLVLLKQDKEGGKLDFR